MKIYIIGPVGSGKSTLSKVLAKKYNTEYYELDKIIWNDDIGIKRPKEETIKLFNNIINKESWIIEDVGRPIFESSYEKCDYIYYLKLPKFILYSRIIKRFVKQKLKIEHSNYKPTFSSLIQMIKWLNSGLKKEKEQLSNLKKYSQKLKILTLKEINKIGKN